MHIQKSDQEILKMGFGNYTCNWGLHIAGLYETEKERDEMIFGLLSLGVSEGDLQLYCPTERSKDDFKNKFSHACPKCASAVDNPDMFSLLSAKDLYYPDGTFSPYAMDKGLNAFYKESQKNGKRNICATAEMVTRNPNYLDSNEWLVQNAPEFLPSNK